MKTIKLTVPHYGWPLSEQINPFILQTPHELGVWGDFKFVVNSDIDNCDYWVVFDQLEKRETCYCPLENTILITGEPPSIKDYNLNYCNQFAHVITCNPNIVHKDVFHYIQGHPWFINKSYDELKNLNKIEKRKEISLITSNKMNTPGHKKRYEFALKIKEHFGDRVDLYGNGVVPFLNKWDVLGQYKYSIIIENLQIEDWITEKLFDCYLTHTFPLYYGCTNIYDYYPRNSLIELDIDNIEHSTELINQIILDKNHYNKMLPFVLEAKERTLNQYNLFPLIVNFIKLKEIRQSDTKQRITLMQESTFDGDRLKLFKRMNFFKKNVFSNKSNPVKK